MSEKLVVLSGKEFLKLLTNLGFKLTRINGSHHRMKHSDGRVTTIPIHKNDDLPKGLIRKIIREDLKIDLEEFEKVVKENL